MQYTTKIMERYHEKNIYQVKHILIIILFYKIKDLILHADFYLLKTKFRAHKR